MTEIKLELDGSLSQTLQNSLSDPIFSPDEDGSAVCITCSDEGRPLTLTRLWDDGYTASANSFRGEETIDISLVSPVSIGDQVLVHAGMAIAKVKG